MNTDHFAKFLFLWFASGSYERTSGDLIPLAESAGLDLAGETLRARQTTLGRWLRLQIGSSVTHDGRQYEISSVFRLGKNYYTVTSTDVHETKKG